MFSLTISHYLALFRTNFNCSATQANQIINANIWDLVVFPVLRPCRVGYQETATASAASSWLASGYHITQWINQHTVKVNWTDNVHVRQRDGEGERWCNLCRFSLKRYHGYLSSGCDGKDGYEYDNNSRPS